MNMRKQAVILSVLLCALLVRVIVAVLVYWIPLSDSVHYPFQLDRDPVLYLMGTQQIIETGINEFNFFPPLHFLFLTACLYIGNGHMLIPALASGLVGWLVVVGTYLLAKSLYGDRIGLIAALISGFYPNLIIYGLSLHPEIPALCFIVFSFLMLVKYFNTTTIWYLVPSGILWGLASQTRGGLHLFSFFIVTALVVYNFGNKLTTTAKASGTFLIATYITIISIAIIVFPIHGDLSLNSKTGVGSIIAGVNRISTSCTDYGHIRGNIYYGILPEEEWPEGSRLDPKEYQNAGRWQVFLTVATFISKDPSTYIKNSLAKLSCLWAPNQLIIKYIKLIGFKENDSPIVNVLCLGVGFIYSVIVIGGLCGIALAKGPFRLLIILLILFYNLLIFLAVGNSKLRLPMMPFIMVYCAYLFSFMFTGIAWKKLFSNKWLILIVLLFIGNTIVKSKEFLLTPAEAHVQMIGCYNDLGFPQTSLYLHLRNKEYIFSDDQQKRIDRAEEAARAEVHVRKIEQCASSGLFGKALHYLNADNQYTFSETQKERLFTAKQTALISIGNNREFAEIYVKRIEQLYELGLFEKALYYLEKDERYNFSEEHKDRMRTIRKKIRVKLAGNKKKQINEQTPVRTFPADSSDEPSSENHWVEAEHANSIIKPLKISDDEKASGGKFIFSPNGTGNHYTPSYKMATYTVTISQAGEYILWGRVRVRDKRANSFFVQLDDGPDVMWEMELSNQWYWDEVNDYYRADPVTFSLSKGEHTIKIKLREDGTKLDKLALTNNKHFVPESDKNIFER